ncbi:MAG: hypothetical protein ACI4MB_02295 [Candidatus Coproplasma sp.]
MKKFLKAITAVLAVVVMAVALVGCGDKYGSIKKAYENEGYTVSEAIVSDKESELKTYISTEQYDKIKDGKLLVCSKTVLLAFVITLGSADKIKDFYGSEEDYNKAVESGYVNGNCVLLFGSTSAVREIFAKA